MTAEKLCEVLGFYNHWITEARNCYAKEMPHDPRNYSHLVWMCDKAEYGFVPAGEVDKAMRWLGFVQGVLLCKGDFTLEQLRAHSRSETVAAVTKIEPHAVSLDNDDCVFLGRLGLQYGSALLTYPNDPRFRVLPTANVTTGAAVLVLDYLTTTYTIGRLEKADAETVTAVNKLNAVIDYFKAVNELKDPPRTA